MILITKQKETYINHAMCECGGEYKFTNNTSEAFGSIFGAIFAQSGLTHTCDKCGKTEKFTKMYPEEVVLERNVPYDSDVAIFMQKKIKG